MNNWNSCFDEIKEYFKKNKISSDESNNSCSCTLKKKKKKVWSDKDIIEIRVKYPEEGFYYDITVLKKLEKLKEKPSDLSVLDNYEHKKSKKITIFLIH